MSWPAEVSQWSFDPPVIAGIVLAALLYWRGWKPVAVVSGTRKAPARGWNAAAFCTGLAVIVVALESPIDALAATSFAFHMLQHLLLIMVAAPLILLGDPAVTILRGVPLTLRRRALGALARQSWVHAAGRWLSWLRSPKSVFAIFVVDLYLWHWSYLYDLTLRNDAVHLMEHLCFLGTAVLFWGQVVDQRAIRSRLPYAQRTVFILITAATSNLLAMYLVFAPAPLYPAYASVSHRPFGLTALADQQYAGAIMWVPVLFLFGGAFAVCLYKALGESEDQSEVVPAAGAPYGMPFAASDSTIAHPAHRS